MVKTMLKEIATATVKRSPKKDKVDLYLSRLIYLFENKLSEEEKVFVARTILESIHYKVSIEDPERIATIYASRTKRISSIIVMVFLGITFIIGILGLSPYLNALFSMVAKITDLL